MPLRQHKGTFPELSIRHCCLCSQGVHFGHGCSCSWVLLGPGSAALFSQYSSKRQMELRGWTVCVTACVGFWDRYLKEGLGVSKGQCQPSHPLCPSGQWGQTAGGTELCAQAGMYTGGADAKFPPSAFFTRNVLVAAPAMKTAYKWCRMGGRGGPPAFPSSISHHRVPCPDQSFPFPWLLC